MALYFFFSWWWIRFLIFFFDIHFYQSTDEASVLISFILLYFFVHLFCILNTEGRVLKAPTRWISQNLWSGSLSFIFQLKSKHVILPTDVHPLFPSVYQGSQWYSKTRQLFDWPTGEKKCRVFWWDNSNNDLTFLVQSHQCTSQSTVDALSYKLHLWNLYVMLFEISRLFP